MIKEIAQYIDNNSAFTLGGTLYVGYLPLENAENEDIPDTITSIIERGEQPNFYLKDATAKRIQIFSRSDDYYTAKNNANVIVDLFHGKSWLILPQVNGGPFFVVDTGEAINRATYMKQDERKRFQFTANLLLRMRLA